MSSPIPTTQSSNESAPKEPIADDSRVDILMVDDSPAKLLTLETILLGLGQNLVQVRSGRDALRKLLHQDFAVILLDVSMPDMDGFETAAMIRQRPSCEHTPIIFVTAINRTETHASMGYQLGAVDYIFTPIVPEVLRAKVNVFVELFRKRREVERQAKRLFELEQREHRRKLDEATERLNLAMEAGRMGAWDWNIRTGEVRWSPAVETMHGYASGAFEGTFDAARRTMHPEDAARVMESVNGAVQERTTFQVEYRILRPDGRTAWVESRGRLFLDDTGEPDRMTGICTDVTDRKLAEEELTRHRDRLEELVAQRTEALRSSQEQLRRSERLASIGTFAAGIAHEINNPLNHILLTAQYASRYMDLNEYQGAFQSIAQAAERGGQIVQSILKFAKADSTQKTPEDANAVVRHAVSVAQTYLVDRRITVDVELASELPPVSLNTTEIEQVLINLIKNAAEASEDGVRVRIATRRNGNGVEVDVEDNGPGIPEEYLPYIFDPFFSTKKKTGGSGLGLSICHGIVADHGGTLSVDSRLGQGTRFRVELPVAESESGSNGQHSGS